MIEKSYNEVEVKDGKYLSRTKNKIGRKKR